MQQALNKIEERKEELYSEIDDRKEKLKNSLEIIRASDCELMIDEHIKKIKKIKSKIREIEKAIIELNVIFYEIRDKDNSS